MARQLLGKKKLKKLSEAYNLDIEKAFVRGGTDHRIDIFMSDGTKGSIYDDYFHGVSGELVLDKDNWK